MLCLRRSEIKKWSTHWRQSSVFSFNQEYFDLI
jgi:hypothetical protein